MEINATLISMLEESYGGAAEEIIRGFGAERKSTFRANTLKASDESISRALDGAGIAYERVNGAFAVSRSDEARVRDLPEYGRGELYMQSLSSMLPPLVLGAQPGENILDMCAAPGGKTSQIAALTGNGALITACEKNAVRAEKLKHNLSLLGAGRVNVLVTDASKLDPIMKFDRILLDAPCTGSGTITPRFPGKFSEKLLSSCVAAQRALLSRAALLLKKGGTLVYSTCSLLPRENEEILLSAARCGLSVAPADILPERAKILPPRIKGALLVAPDEYYEGFFIAKMLKPR